VTAAAETKPIDVKEACKWSRENMWILGCCRRVFGRVIHSGLGRSSWMHGSRLSSPFQSGSLIIWKIGAFRRRRSLTR